VNEPSVRALESFGRDLAARSKGRFRVEVYPNNALGNEREVIELAIIGAVELTCPSNAPLATFVPELLIFDLPYLFRDRAHMYAVLDGEIGRSFAAPLARRGLRLLGYFDVGLRHLMTRSPVTKLEDLAGLKIRTMENPLHLAAFQAFGASPLPMAYGEVYTALEQGVIDGAEASSANYHAKRFYEVAPHWTEISWMYLVSPLVMSERFYSALAPPDQELIRDAAARAIAWEREAYGQQERRAEVELEAAGIRILRPDASALREAARRVWRQAGDRVDLALVEAIANTR
jgi:tripartite ATP-independent transporter DctP family solute receptor